ncbi:Similar to X-element\ORF2: Probable RNA-directed DNA polymerase from transposon X-element (Drosophila melanogaster) [Cotesia congregata]|uniref:Similar to X-element\ORF2: Probable RNA-directed DNA polymerase from transposon X-element (Drosophila melanogaster) n=1 Tax=Cotesia congregata TaxID=51543 RepID=A0A8J2MLT1_COTCN|nr:Similar to X-element\ORF2: Probable RNA-directed DNA polymerase from transposon X-element (Drosophila melanogaster) [Cotesia congregata]
MVISDIEGSDSDSTDRVSDASGSLDINLPEGSSTLISTPSIEPTPKYSRRGRTPKAEQLKKFRSSSFGDIADYFKKNSLKRSRENGALSNPKRTEDSPSPPNKVSRSSSSPPSMSRGKLEDVKSRVSVIESNANLPSGSGSTVHDLERQIINNSINSVEKHIRRNNIIIRGLTCDEANVKKTVAEFLDTHLNTKNCIESVSILNKTKDSIKVVLKDQEVKQKILKNKRLLKVPVYINSDLTPEESYIAKRLRDEGKKLKTEGNNIKHGFQKLIVNGTPMTWDKNLNALANILNTASTVNITFWNAHGQQNIPEIINSSTASLICISETWATDDLFLSSLSQSAKKIFVPATKPLKQGRPSGGLIIFSSLTSTTISSSKSWIIAKVSASNLTIITALIYFKPNENLEETLDLLQLTLSNIFHTHQFNLFIAGGDFNARVGNESQVQEDVTVNTNLDNTRNSRDQVCNHQGRLVMRFMEDNGFILLNGRSPGDQNGDFTFCSASGKSIIDLIWVNILGLQHVSDMWVEDMVTNSDHLPVTIRLHTGLIGDLVQAEQNSMQLSPLRWNENHADLFRHYITWSSLIKIDTNSASVDDFNKQLTVAITEAAREAQMSQASRKYSPERKSKPWFDNSCKDRKAMLKNILRQCKLSNNSDPVWAIYLQSKKDYYSYLKLRKQEYINVIQAKFAKTRNIKDFWDTVKSVQRSSRSQNSIALVEWENFFHKVYPPRITFNLIWHSDLHQQLDVEITLEELQESLKKCKSNKAAGMDNISNEFLKNLPENWQLFILAYFNKILVTETLPLDWTKIITTMLFKKGDPTDPENYRSIALINSITKVFTQILCSRIRKWAEAEKIIPEEQSGFQPGKSCANNVFTLLSLLQMQLRFGKPVYTLFIDSRRAFDSVPHDKLWTKLMNLGLSSKLINILKILYDNAQMRVRVNGQLSEPVNVTLGVLQGEVLSPLLFILYLSDITFFSARGYSDVTSYLKKHYFTEKQKTFFKKIKL